MLHFRDQPDVRIHEEKNSPKRQLSNYNSGPNKKTSMIQISENNFMNTD